MICGATNYIFRVRDATQLTGYVEPPGLCILVSLHDRRLRQWVERTNIQYSP